MYADMMHYKELWRIVQMGTIVKSISYIGFNCKKMRKCMEEEERRFMAIIQTKSFILEQKDKMYK